MKRLRIVVTVVVQVVVLCAEVGTIVAAVRWIKLGFPELAASSLVFGMLLWLTDDAFTTKKVP